MIEKKLMSEFHRDVDAFLSSKETKTWYWEIDKLIVNYGYKNDCNLEYCHKHNIPVVNIKRGGGCIVSVPGNINLVDIRIFDGHTWLAHMALKEFTEYLKGRGLNAEFDHNDVMIDGYKVASGISTNLRPSYEMQYTGLQFSVNQDIEIIREVCLKEMRKQPKGLSEFGITTKDVERWILSKQW